MSFVDDLPVTGVRAISTPDGECTYAELKIRIDRLARRMRGCGVGTDQVCAIVLRSGLDSVVGIAAVLRAGAAFLAIDVELPRQRIEALLRGAHALLTTSELAATLDGLIGARRVILLDGATPDPPVVELPATTPARSLAYISHTSGSTGTPNAVMIEHRGLTNYLQFVVDDYRLDSETVALQLAPFGYDASIRDTFAPLLAGGRLVLLPRSTLLRPGGFFDALEQYGVNTILSATPSFLTFLAQQDQAAERSRGLRLVVASGESMRPFLASGGRALFGGRLVNQYGPTECTMTSTRFDVPAQPDTTEDLIGTAIAGVSARLLDGNLEAVSDGAVGEIFIGGAGVGRGYLDRPGLSAGCFVPDPCGAPGTRLYRTGDLGRRRPSGDLEYLGRRDRQIKIRGYRVDPGEVEAALLTYPAVTGAAVTSDTDSQNRVFLVAHLTGDLEQVRDAALRSHLAEALPPHLMPRRFSRLDRFPETTSGKVDRGALATAGGRR